MLRDHRAVSLRERWRSLLPKVIRSSSIVNVQYALGVGAAHSANCVHEDQVGTDRGFFGGQVHFTLALVDGAAHADLAQCAADLLQVFRHRNMNYGIATVAAFLPSLGYGVTGADAERFPQAGDDRIERQALAPDFNNRSPSSSASSHSRPVSTRHTISKLFFSS
jgi:hypothetical protein